MCVCVACESGVPVLAICACVAAAGTTPALTERVCACVRVCVCGLQCDLEISLRQGGYTTRFTGLKFINSPRRVRWTSPFKEIVLVCSGAVFPHHRTTIPVPPPSSPLACMHLCP